MVQQSPLAVAREPARVSRWHPVTAGPPLPRARSRRASPRPATEERSRVRLPGGELACILRRSPRARRLRVTIDHRRGLVVTVPVSRPPSMRAIESFLAEREDWVRRHVARRADAVDLVAARGGIADGATVMYLGLPHRLRVVTAPPGRRTSTVSRVGGDDGDELVVAVRAGERRSVSAILEGWYRVRARAIIGRAIERHAAALGVVPAAVSIRDQQTRWGSASRSGRLAFSWRLVLTPPGVLDSVVVHELAHLRVFGHGPAFWAVVATRCPDYRKWRGWLRRHSVELHATLAEIEGVEGTGLAR